MNTSMGLWDALFGERITLDLPLPDGTTKKVRVTRRWWTEMVKQGKVKDVSASVVTVNILEEPPPPADGASLDELYESLGAEIRVRIEPWRVGTEVPKEQYDKFVDSQSKELYAIRKHSRGGAETVLVQRRLWEQARQAMGS